MSNKSKILVTIQFISFAVILINTKAIAHGFWLLPQIIGFIIALLATFNLGIGNFNIQPEVKNQAFFKTQGMYQYVRNPIYLGLIIYFSAIIGNDFSVLSIIVLLILIVVLLLKINMEENFLTDRFKNDYITYKNRTKRLLPFIY
jgi:protein-S-isoprenylcysteine O-methyltransferase Ste14